MFSRVVSDTLETIAYIGSCLGLDRGDASFLILDDFESCDLRSLRRRWSKAIERRRRTWEELVGVPLPPVVFKPSDLEYVQRLESQANYVTEDVIEARTALLMSPVQVGQIDLTGKIVVVEAADPGYDWIFAFRLAGLVTKYGGAGSHMAVRCAEFRIPAALGCGESFDNLLDASVIRLDCGRKELRVVSRY
jgi:phosphohistidine swiveling domain-containing protein